MIYFIQSRSYWWIFTHITKMTLMQHKHHTVQANAIRIGYSDLSSNFEDAILIDWYF